MISGTLLTRPQNGPLVMVDTVYRVHQTSGVMQGARELVYRVQRTSRV